MINLTKITNQIDNVSKVAAKNITSSLKLQPQLTADAFVKTASVNLERTPKFSSLIDTIVRCGHYKTAVATSIDYDLFKKNFGFELLSPTMRGLNAFKYGIESLYKNKECIPAGIDALLIGHGKGSSLKGDWCFCENNEKVMDYLSTKLESGKKVLVFTCETANNATKEFPGIGNTVITSLDNPMHPAKIVEVGKGIIGHFVNNQAVYY